MSAKGFVAAAIVGIGAWALARYSEDRKGQTAYVTRVKNTHANGDLAVQLTDGLFSMFDALRNGDSGGAKRSGQGVLDNLLSDLPILNTGTTFSPQQIPASMPLSTQRQKVQVPSTIAPANTSVLSLSRDHGQETHSGVTVVYAMGPKRPYRPDLDIVRLVAAAVRNAYGVGSKIVITSGQEGNLPQHGSNRHKTGKALDCAVYKPSGARVRVHEFDALARAAARMGALGIGYGPEYMGNVIHIDRVMPGRGQDHAWGTLANAIQPELTRLMGVS